MIAKALIGILPELTLEEALETTKIHSIAGLLTRKSHNHFAETVSFLPIHTVSYAGLSAGGRFPDPVKRRWLIMEFYFLDELPEFSRTVLEVLRQPLEECQVTICRANGNFTFPTSFYLVSLR